MGSKIMCVGLTTTCGEKEIRSITRRCLVLNNFFIKDSNQFGYTNHVEHIPSILLKIHVVTPKIMNQSVLIWTEKNSSRTSLFTYFLDWISGLNYVVSQLIS